jgi:sialate O-acetylesterase
MLRACLIAFFALLLPAVAELTLPRLFSDNMILQQQTDCAVWGWADAGQSVSVKASWGAEATGKADADGKWKVFIATPKAGTGHTLSINDRTFKNVAIGEVWLCAGQSNMGWSVGNSFGGEEEVASADDPDLRIFKSQREHWYEPLDIPRDRLAAWSGANPTSAQFTSAVSYYFAKKLRQELDIPVGIIVQAYAGTPIEGWMPTEIQLDDPRTVAGIKEMKERRQRMTREAALEKYNKELATYNGLIDKGETMKNKVRLLSPPIITQPQLMGHQAPSNIFNVMIYPVRPYAIRGMIWYQGERNSKTVPQALNYKRQLPLMIRYYRRSWHEMSAGNTADDFPFYFVQLPSWNPPQTKPVEGVEAVWAVNREMMRQVSLTVENTGMAVSIDTGDAIGLHPKNKQPIGQRMAYLALKGTYDKPIVGNGPTLHKHTINGGSIVLELESTGSGLMAAKPGKLDAFAIAGADRVWHWADAKIKGKTVTVSSAAVAKPVAVRYAWAMNPSERNLLYNKEGLPASPFRTDDWPLFDPEKDEEVQVHKPAKPDGYQSKDWTRPAMTQ